MSSTSSKSRYHQNRRHSSSAAANYHHNSDNSFHMQEFNTPISMFHSCQDSSMLLTEFTRRNISCFEQKRRAEYDRCRNLTQPNKIPPVNLPRPILPTKIRLTMEIQGSDFSSLHDGREAWAQNDSLSKIILDTQCLIQFANQYDPSSDALGIFNQVTIIGDMPNIDLAMNRLRAFSPITIVAPLKNLKDGYDSKDIINIIRQWYLGDELRDFNRIQFSILYPATLCDGPNTEMHSESLVVRGSRKDAKMMTAASDAITKLLFKDNQRPIFYASLEIPASQRRMIVGSPEGVLIKTISTQTKCTIHFPSSEKAKSTHYYLSGNAGAVIQALRALQDISPVRLEFEAENHHLINSLNHDEEHRELDQFDIEHAVIVQLRKSPYEGEFRLERESMRHSLTLMTSEENVQNLYKIRQQLLIEACWKHEPLPKCSKNGPRYLDFLKILVLESAMRAYIGESKVISVCRCRNQLCKQAA